MEALVVHLEVFVFQVTPLLIDVLLVKVVVAWWDEWRCQFLLFEFLEWEVPQPGVVFHFLSAIVGPESVLRFTLDHLQSDSQLLTLLIKSAASTDQPRGISCRLIWIYFDKIWSLISFLDLPT